MKMITRAQANALLNLAESLEACEALNIRVAEDYDGVRVLSAETDTTLYWAPNCYMRGMSIRLAVNALVPNNVG